MLEIKEHNVYVVLRGKDLNILSSWTTKLKEKIYFDLEKYYPELKFFDYENTERNKVIYFSELMRINPYKIFSGNAKDKIKYLDFKNLLKNTDRRTYDVIYYNLVDFNRERNGFPLDLNDDTKEDKKLGQKIVFNLKEYGAAFKEDYIKDHIGTCINTLVELFFIDNQAILKFKADSISIDFIKNLTMLDGIESVISIGSSSFGYIEINKNKQGCELVEKIDVYSEEFFIKINKIFNKKYAYEFDENQKRYKWIYNTKLKHVMYA